LSFLSSHGVVALLFQSAIFVSAFTESVILFTTLGVVPLPLLIVVGRTNYSTVELTVFPRLGVLPVVHSDGSVVWPDPLALILLIRSSYPDVFLSRDFFVKLFNFSWLSNRGKGQA